MRVPIKLIRVIDGDTIQVICRGLKETVRLNSVDTEESAIGYGKPATAAGIRAKHYTREICQSGELYLSLDDFSREEDREEDEDFSKNRDKFNRLLAHIYIDVGSEEIHINRELIQLGFSPYFNKYGGSRLYDSDFREAQREAQRQDLMIWGDANAGSATRNYERLLPWWDKRATALDLARYSVDGGKYDVDDGKRIWICDNECRSIAEYVSVSREFVSGYICCLLDFQGGCSSRFAKGWVVSTKSEGFLIRLFFSNKFLQESQNLELVQQLIDEKDYGFVAGTLAKYRGIPQIEVFSLATTPFDLNLP